MKCVNEGCSNTEILARGLCKKCYSSMRSKNRLEDFPKIWKQKPVFNTDLEGRICLSDDCNEEVPGQNPLRLYCTIECKNQTGNRKMTSEKTKIRRDERHHFLGRIKVERGCIDCGYNENPWALHFDHKDPDQKTFNVGGMVNFSFERLLDEIAKCEVRCANCHAIHTGYQFGWTDFREQIWQEIEDGMTTQVSGRWTN